MITFRLCWFETTQTLIEKQQKWVDMTGLGIAVIGTGMIGRLHVRSARSAGATLIGVGASDTERGARAAAELGAGRVYARPEAVADDPDVDVVHICTPNALHAPYARAALSAGKHVVCEKPLGLDLAEARELYELAAEMGSVATVPFAYRFYPTVREARARVADGRLGDVRLIHGSYLQDWLSAPDAHNWRVDAHSNGRSRAFADIGSHWCDLVEFVTGDRIVSVSAVLSAWHPRANGVEQIDPAAPSTEDVAVVMFVTETGATGSVVVSQVSPGRKNRLWFELDGTDASTVFDQENPETLWLGRKDSATVLHRGQDPRSQAAAALDVVPVGHPQGFTDCFALFVAHTYAAIAGNTPDGLPTFADGLRSAHIVDAVLRSASTGGFVKV
ncbi:1,5-anhydro-D-fructose reductase [Rhodococcus sp. T7]|nr:1,5-anhydro-D-fructose reductase [Rhodococcus sp. T7]